MEGKRAEFFLGIASPRPKRASLAPQVPFLVLRAATWLEDQQCPGHRFRGFISGRLNFDRTNGERVPSVHVASKQADADQQLT